MVDYGVNITNSNDVLIIDSQYKNHVYHAHGTSFVQQYLNEIDIPNFSGNGIFFIKPTSFFTASFGFIKNGNDFDKIVIASDSTGFIDWIVYKDISSTNNENYGFNVIDSSSSIVFSSGEKGYVNIKNDGIYSQQQETVEDADNNYISIVGYGLSYDFDLVFSGGFKTVTYTREMVGMKKINSTTLDFDFFTYDVQIDQTVDGGSGSFFNNGTSAAIPQRYIEISPPPSI